MKLSKLDVLSQMSGKRQIVSKHADSCPTCQQANPQDADTGYQCDHCGFHTDALMVLEVFRGDHSVGEIYGWNDSTGGKLSFSRFLDVTEEEQAAFLRVAEEYVGRHLREWVRRNELDMPAAADMWLTLFRSGWSPAIRDWVAAGAKE